MLHRPEIRQKPPIGELEPTKLDSDASRTLIELKQVLKVYDTPAGSFTVLKNVDLQVNAGEFVAVIGKSGSGKSTLINMITGIDRPTFGEVIVDGMPIHALNEDQMAKWRGRHLGVIFQFFQLLPTLTVLENVMLPMELRQTYPQNQRKERGLYLLDMVGLADQAFKFPAAISGGQQQRVAIARALANDPDVLVGDEPTGSLDSKTADSIFRLFEEFVAQGRTILIVTHDRELAGRVPRVVFINDGEITDQHLATALPSLSQVELAGVSAKLEPIKYAPGEVIISQGDSADHFYILVKGSVDVLLRHPSGAEVIAGQLSAGQYFGEMGLMEGGTRTATVRANTEVVAMQLDRESFTSLVSNSDLTRDQIMHLMRQRAMEQQLSEVLPILNPAQLDAVMSEVEAAEYQSGDTIVESGEPATRFFIIIEGAVELLSGSTDGTEQSAREVASGQTFGEMDLVRGGAYSFTARATHPSVVMAVDNETITNLSEKYHVEQGEIVQMLTRRYLETVLDGMLPKLRRRKRQIDMDLNFDVDTPPSPEEGSS